MGTQKKTAAALGLCLVLQLTKWRRNSCLQRKFTIVIVSIPICDRCYCSAPLETRNPFHHLLRHRPGNTSCPGGGVSGRCVARLSMTMFWSVRCPPRFACRLFADAGVFIGWGACISALIWSRLLGLPRGSWYNIRPSIQLDLDVIIILSRFYAS